MIRRLLIIEPTSRPPTVLTVEDIIEVNRFLADAREQFEKLFKEMEEET
jgi:hypothetical protein